MGKNIVFYVSGHGYGHAARTAEVMRALAAREPGWGLHVRTSAPHGFFAAAARCEAVALDAGMAERGPLHLDPRATLERAAGLLAGKAALVESEIAYLRHNQVSLVAADAPFLAGEVAAAAGLPCVAVSNFTWDWIYEPFIRELPAYADLLEEIRSGYRRMTALLRLPFADREATDGLFREVVDAPLLARRSERDSEETLRAAGLDPRDPRPRILIGMRGGVPDRALVAAVRASPDLVFITLDAPRGTAAENLRRVAPSSPIHFVDLLRASTVVLSKLGYGIVADCIANGTALLYPPRTGFREDEITRVQAPSYLRIRELPLPDYETGAWSAPLQALLNAPAPPTVLPADGAEACAAFLARLA